MDFKKGLSHTVKRNSIKFIRPQVSDDVIRQIWCKVITVNIKIRPLRSVLREVRDVGIQFSGLEVISVFPMSLNGRLKRVKVTGFTNMTSKVIETFIIVSLTLYRQKITI